MNPLKLPAKAKKTSTKNVTPARPPEKSASVKIKKILLPVDFSEQARPAIAYAKWLAELTGAELFLLNVVQPMYVGEVISYIPTNDVEYQHSIERKIGGLQVSELGNIRSDYAVRTGTPFEEIVNVAAEIRADLIVMTTHGYSGMKHLFMGSTAERVVRHALCPVLVIRSKFANPARRRKNGQA